LFKSLFNENQLIGPQKYTFAGSKSSQNASIFHEKNDGGVHIPQGMEVSKSTDVLRVKKRKNGHFLVGRIFDGENHLKLV